ncbi:MAG: NAD(P)H-dependent oxidoreductase [Silicimonas sp.]|nr:NAD(P)H-dependent oxidoreductase [Silicimonas sp.]RZW12510.1 MAG: flavodoxin family protein [Paracoccaceae bacterium]MBT8425698.1 NAD(P)H-dependent oxidoreductase [Silicimonas sp.]NND19612.1 NAD(P)H-dependent oxidoreductase [Silicimonas sp.]NNL35673.1 NAD(P)H-dependent oxidoreductase [Silicimonas sp.]
MKALVVYCHPCETSFTAAVRDTVRARLDAAGAEIRVIDIYARGFDPVLTAAEHECYERHPENCVPVQSDVDDLQWADTLIFVYPTWWFGQPAVLKGWLDRVLLPEVAFLMPDADSPTIRPGLTHITRLGVFTTCGASRWVTFLVGAPGKRTILRGIGLLCAPRCKKTFAAHYLMDSSTDTSRKAHLDRVAAKLDRFLR